MPRAFFQRWLGRISRPARPKLHGWFLMAITVAALMAPVIAPHDPCATDVLGRLQPPSAEYLFGTDALGRCVLSRLIHGGAVSLGMGLGILILSFAVGGVLGILAGYFGGWWDEGIMRLTDVFMAIPSLVTALVLARSLGPGVLNMIWIVSFSMWPGYARMVRGLAMQIKNEHYMEVAVMAGLGTGYILRRHLLPAILPPLLTMATLGMGRTVLMTSSLSFLGLGIVAPTPDWGAMLNSGVTYIRIAPHIALFPGLLISFTVLSLNLLGDRFAGNRAGGSPAGTMRTKTGAP